MALELEYKLQLPSEDLIEFLLADPEILSKLEAPFREVPMETTYYDSSDLSFSSRHWTLRHRMEGMESIICLKTPGSLAHSRNEWQISAPSMTLEAIKGLMAEGAPEELLSLYTHSLPRPICGARFLRRCAILKFADGSQGELALDLGQVFGPKGNLPILELELELYSGDPTEMTLFARSLCKTYGLREQLCSKFARARSLL